MYNKQSSILSIEWGNFLNQYPWDFFSTITYQFDINLKRNEGLMLKLEAYLLQLKRPFKLFWITEFHKNMTQTHNHMLVQGKWVVEYINSFFLASKVVRKQGLVRLQTNLNWPGPKLSHSFNF